MRRLLAVGSLSWLLALPFGPVVAGAEEPPPDPALASLPQVTSGRRPGPDLLYAPPPANRQLQNHDPEFRAPFTLVSASERYVGGEYQVED
ncbi:MAG: hypothetical protein M3Q68_02780, partial [Actinomycetota bacterium]|nr:hypothetical protein [Actinomycetota bacterium]